MDHDFTAAKISYDLTSSIYRFGLGWQVRRCPIGMRPHYVPTPLRVWNNVAVAVFKHLNNLVLQIQNLLLGFYFLKRPSQERG